MGLFGADTFLGALGPSIISGGLSAFGAASANSSSRKQAANQFAWQLDADRHKYRRAVYDLKKAGLNPILAAKGGISGGGNISPGALPTFKNPYENAVNAAGLKRMNAEISKLKADAQLGRQKNMTEIAEQIALQQKSHLDYAQKKMIEAQIPAVAASAKTEAVRQAGVRAFLGTKTGAGTLLLNQLGMTPAQAAGGAAAAGGLTGAGSAKALQRQSKVFKHNQAIKQGKSTSKRKSHFTGR